MNEQLQELGLTEEVYRNDGISRRNLVKLSLVTGGALLASGCGFSISFLTAKRWSREEIVDLGMSMQSEPQYNDIVYAGWVLVESQSKRPSLSRLSPLFIDEPIQVLTADNAGLYMGYPDVEAPMGARVKPTGQQVQVDLRSKIDGSSMQFSSYPDLQFMDIVIDKRLTSGMSDFVFRFLVQKKFSML